MQNPESMQIFQCHYRLSHVKLCRWNITCNINNSFGFIFFQFLLNDIQENTTWDKLHAHVQVLRILESEVEFDNKRMGNHCQYSSLHNNMFGLVERESVMMAIFIPWSVLSYLIFLLNVTLLHDFDGEVSPGSLTAGVNDSSECTFT